MDENNEFKKNCNKAMDSAVRVLARRSHTKYEIRQKLRQRGFSTDVISKVLSECERLNYVNDEETARIYLRELRSKGYGPRRISVFFKKKGIGHELTDTLLHKDNAEDELETAHKAFSKKLTTFDREKDMRKRREKIYRYLYYRGFSSSVISEVIRMDSCEID